MFQNPLSLRNRADEIDKKPYSFNRRQKKTFGKNKEGNKVETGCIITLSEVKISEMFECDNYTTGYSFIGEAPPEGFDYKLTVRYNDKDVVYSMKDKGLFKKLNNNI